MKTKFVVSVLILLLAVAACRAGLWDPPLDNPSFENIALGAGAWTQEVDEWFKSDWWGSFVERERTTGDIPETPYGENWAGLDYDGYIYQEIGTWEGTGLYDVQILYGQRIYDDFRSIDISIYAGGYSAGGADDVSLEQSGATKLSTVTVTPPSFMRLRNSWPSSMIVRSAEKLVSHTLSNPARRKAEYNFPVTAESGAIPNSSPIVALIEGANSTTTCLFLSRKTSST